MPSLDRRTVLATIATGSVLGLAGCSSSCPDEDLPSPEQKFKITDKSAGTVSKVPSTDWQRPLFDAGNTGYAPDARLPTDRVGVYWRRSLDSQEMSTPIVAGDTIVVGSENRIHALDIRDGTGRWTNTDVEITQFDTEGIYHSGLVQQGTVPPAADGDGTIYVGGTNSLTALNVTDGRVRWEYTESSNFGPPTVLAGTVYATARDGIVALDTTDGTEQWRWTADISPSLMAVSEGTVVFSGDSAGSDQKTVALDAVSGQQRWQRTAYVANGHPVVSDGIVYLGDTDGLHALTLDDGTHRFTFDRNGRQFKSPIVTDDTIYTVEVPGEDGKALFALDRTENNPSPRWCSEIRDGEAVSASTEHVLAVIEADLVTLDASRGNSPWSCQSVDVVPQIVLDNLVIAQRERALVALGEV